MLTCVLVLHQKALGVQLPATEFWWTLFGSERLASSWWCLLRVVAEAVWPSVWEGLSGPGPGRVCDYSFPGRGSVLLSCESQAGSVLLSLKAQDTSWWLAEGHVDGFLENNPSFPDPMMERVPTSLAEFLLFSTPF